MAGMGQYQEAQTLITESYNGLKAALGDAAQAVGESQYYLAMLPLLTADSEDALAQSDPMLMQVCTAAMLLLLLPFALTAFLSRQRNSSNSWPAQDSEHHCIS